MQDDLRGWSCPRQSEPMFGSLQRNKRSVDRDMMRLKSEQIKFCLGSAV